MTKRIAIQLFGHLRSFRKTYQGFYENIILPNEKAGYKIDIFLHTWNETDHSTITWHNQNGELRGKEIDDEVIEFIEKNYKPKKYMIEPQVAADDYIITEKIAGVPRAYKGVVNVSYTKYMANKLRLDYEKEHKIKYDYVIVTRPDILFHKPFDIDKLLYVYKNYGWEPPGNGLFFGYNLFSRGDVEDKHLLGGIDIIFFAKPENITKATSFYELVKNNKITPPEVGKDFYCFEIFWYNYWLSQGLEPIRVKYFQFSAFNIIRNEEEYNLAQNRFQEEELKIKNIKVNSFNNCDENVKFIVTEKHSSCKKSSKYNKFKQNFSKLLKYYS